MRRFFFHSFPRPRRGETRDKQIQKGALIARSLLQNGLLLCPETYELPVVGNDGITNDRFDATQRRMCFTELEPDGLSEHSKIFGPFALAYRIEDLRPLGALPVFYIPLESGGYLSRLPLELIGGIVDAHRIAGTLAAVQKQLRESPALGLTYRGIAVNFTADEANTIRSFIDVLMQSAGASFEVTDFRLAAAASCFYATENPQYTQPLHYYRQREWRIVQGMFTFEGMAVSYRASPEQVKELLEIDSEFFSKALSFFEPKKGIGAKVKDAIAGRCYFLDHVGDLDAVGIAHALILPDDSKGIKDLEAAYRKRGVNVIRASDAAQLG